MADTSIRVSTETRDRLALLAAEHGTTIGGVVSELAAGTLTEVELRARGEAAERYIREHLHPGMTDAEWADAVEQGDALLEHIRQVHAERRTARSDGAGPI